MLRSSANVGTAAQTISATLGSRKTHEQRRSAFSHGVHVRAAAKSAVGGAPTPHAAHTAQHSSMTQNLQIHAAAIRPRVMSPNSMHENMLSQMRSSQAKSSMAVKPIQNQQYLSSPGSLQRHFLPSDGKIVWSRLNMPGHLLGSMDTNSTESQMTKFKTTLSLLYYSTNFEYCEPII
jgi:hypothetical protein